MRPTRKAKSESMKTFFSKLLGNNNTPIQQRESVKRIGNYSIVREIGAGATSNVYLGIHSDTMSAVAIKQLSPQCTSPSHRQMFATESSLCGKMEHPNIVSLYGADLDAPNGPYLLMEYVDGNSLDKFDTPETLLSIETVIDVMRQSAEALRHASSLGIIHRDVKPGNIIIRKDGRVKIADFGCAITNAAEGALVSVAGSLPYMSPEQIEGKPLNQQADIYSLGAVFYRLLTGHYPFEIGDGQTAQSYVRKVLKTAHTSISAYRQDVPAEIVKLVDRSLQRKLNKRHASWDEFLECLNRASMAKYAEDEQLNVNWQSFRIRQHKLAKPRTHELSFSF
jgi:eukaryotic-like serine/threonine-protein kinase